MAERTPDPGRLVLGERAAASVVGHAKDVSTPGEYGVKYLRFWIDEGAGRVVCLIEAPNGQTAMRFHREGHGGYETGLIHQVQEGP
jgi:hypothetical protein